MSRKETTEFEKQINFTKLRDSIKKAKENPQEFDWTVFKKNLSDHCSHLTKFFEIKDVRDFIEIVSPKNGEPSKLDSEMAYYLSKMINNSLSLGELLEIYNQFQSNKKAVESHDENYDRFYNKVISLLEENKEFPEYLTRKVSFKKTEAGAEASAAEKRIIGFEMKIEVKEGNVNSSKIVIEFKKESLIKKFFQRVRSKSSGSSAESASSVDEEHLTVPKEDELYQLTLDKFANFYLREISGEPMSPSTSASASAAASPARPLRPAEQGNNIDLFG